MGRCSCGLPVRAPLQIFVPMCLVSSACAEAPASTYHALPALREALAPLGLEVEPVSDAAANLAWQAPARDCPQVLRLSASYTPAQMHEQDSVSWLALGRDPDHDDHVADGVAIPAGETAALELYYRGLRAERRGQVRDASASAAFYGPAAPTAACMPRTWDPMEDAFALGWPLLPARTVAVDEHWNGLRVEGKCNRSPCVDPQTGGGGPDNHHRACISMPWRERLAGVYEIAGQRVALVESHWDDGHEGQGIETDRMTLVSLDHGRPLWSRTRVNHRFPQPTADRSFAPVVRTWELQAQDGCAGALPQLGVAIDADARAAIDDALAQLADAENLRRADARARRENPDDGTVRLPSP